MSITKEVKCLKCGSYIHDTIRCTEWCSINYCCTDEKFKKECNCLKCEKHCIYCNDIIDPIFGKCLLEHDGSRCIECNEFLIFQDEMICGWDHMKPFCKFCNLPVSHFGSCGNDHYESDPICSECNMPENNLYKHEHDNNKCKICNTLLNKGYCIYGCADGGVFCIHCGYEGVVNNVCPECNENNSGHLTKRAIK